MRLEKVLFIEAYSLVAHEFWDHHANESKPARWRMRSHVEPLRSTVCLSQLADPPRHHDEAGRGKQSQLWLEELLSQPRLLFSTIKFWHKQK